jgi:hypothetical protein
MSTNANLIQCRLYLADLETAKKRGSKHRDLSSWTVAGDRQYRQPITVSGSNG